MAAVSLLGSTINTTAGAKNVTATPAVDDLIVIIVYHSGDVTWSNPTDDQSGTYDLVGSIIANGTTCGIGIYVRTAKIASGVSTIFTAPNPGSDTGGGLAVLKVTGMAKVGSAAVRQSKSAVRTGGDSAYTGDWASAKLTTNPVIGALMSDSTNSVGPTTGYTELFEIDYSTPTMRSQAQSIDSGDTTNTMNWTGVVYTGGMNGVVIGVELDASASASQGNMFLIF